MKNNEKHYSIDINTLHIAEMDTESVFGRGSVVEKLEDGTTKCILTSYRTYHMDDSTISAAILAIKGGLEIPSTSCRLLMIIAIYKILAKKGIKSTFSSNNICAQSSIPVTGFSGMYVYFKLGIRADRVELNYFTIDHAIANNWQDASDKYKLMSSQITKMPSMIKAINTEYKRIKKQLTNEVERVAV
jgi:hypothetical protein